MPNVPNYTDEQTLELVTAYVACKTDGERQDVMDIFEEKFDKTPASIRSKLSTEKVYKKPEKMAKNGQPSVKKEDLAKAIAKKLGVRDVDAVSLTKATKGILENVLAQFEFLEAGFVSDEDMTEDQEISETS